MTDKISEMRSAGFSEDEIQDWLKSTSSEMTAAGFSQEEIIEYTTGAKPPNDEAMRRTFEQLLSAASVDKDGKPKPLTFAEALEAGWGMSVGVPGMYGLANEGKMPELQLTGEEPWYSRLGYGAAQMVGDIPASVMGAAVGGSGGLASGPGAVATASAGAFAMPALLRSTMIDAYTKGEFQSFPDFVDRASGIFLDTAKAYTIGLVAPAVGGEVGGRVGGAIGEKVLKTASPTATKVGYTTGEVTTMVALGTAMEGQVPKAQDFADAALLLLGAKVAVRTAQTGKTVLMDVWKKTGIPPWKVVADAKSDPTIAQDIAMGKEIPRAYESQVDPIFKTPAAKPETPAPKNITSDTETPPDAASSPSATRPPPVTPGEIRTQRDALFKIADNLGVKVTQEDGRYYARMDKPEINVPSGAGGLPPEYGLTPDFVFAHELGHAIVIRFGAIFSNKRDDSGRFSFWSTKKLRREISNWDEFTDASKEVRPEFWNNPALKQQDYVRTPDELVADTIAAVLTGKRDISILYPMMKTLGMKPESFGLDPGGWRLGGGGGGKGGGGDDGFPAPASGAPEPGSLREAQDTILSKVDLGGKDAVEYPTFEDLYTKYVDDLAPINQAVKEMSALIPGGKVAADQNSYFLSRLTRGLFGKAQLALRFGTFDFATMKVNGKSLQDVLTPIKDDLNGLRAYAIASRALELKDRFIVSGFNIDAAAKVVAESKAKFEPVMRELVEFQNRVTKQLVDSGIISEETYAKMLELNKQFVPFYRVLEDSLTQPSGRGSLLPRDPIKGIKGSGLVVVDPLESIIKNTFTYITLADRNALIKQFHDLAVKTGTPDVFFEKKEPDFKATTVTDKEMQTFLKNNGIEQMPKEALTVFRAVRQPLEKNEVQFFEDGKRVIIKVDEDVATAFKALDRQSVGALVKLLSVPATLQRAGTTLTPDFIIKAFSIDQISAFVQSKVGFIPIVDAMRGAVSLFKKDDAFKAWLASGGANATLVSLDRRYIQSEIYRLIGERPETNFTAKVWNLAKTPLEFLQIAAEAIDNSTRLGEYKKTLRKMGTTPQAASKAQMVEAGMNAREVTLDYSRMGSQVTAINLMTAFFNAQLQGVDKTIRNIKENPRALTKIALGVTLPSVILWAYNNTYEKERWDEVKDWERDMYWIIFTPDHTIRIPKPFELGVIFGSLPERMLDAIVGNSSEKEARNFLQTAFGAFLPRIIPSFAEPVIEDKLNYNFFTGRDLVPSYLENPRTGVLPEYRYTEYTSELSKALGGILGEVPWVGDSSTASPIVIENYVRSWTGGVGGYALQIADYGLRKAGVLPDPVLPESTLSDIPIIKVFVARYPTASAKSIQDFRDEYVGRVQRYNSIIMLAKQGDFDASMRVMQMNPQALVRMDEIDRALSEHNLLIRRIYKNPSTPADEKRQQIERAYLNMIEMARLGNKLMKETDEVLLKQPK